MFLTQFDINVARRDAMRLLASPERLHAAVLSAFPPGQSTSDDTRTLWRLDRGPAKHDARLMIVSPLQPDLTTLNEQAGWSTGVPGRSADYDPFLRGLMFHYGLDFHDLASDAILHISSFIVVCEAFLHVTPHFGLWLKTFNVKPKIIEGRRSAEVL
ncbi:MAG: hypothetical protein DI619_04760, partial [Francisella sp.]